MKNKVLAIGIPSYNAEPYLDRCMGTLLHPDLLDRIEVLIVNDGSKDRTQELADGYQERYPQTVRAINKENGGHGSAVNAALYATEAKYYKVVDVDDWVDTAALIKLVDLLEKTDVDVVTSAYNQVDMVTGKSEKIDNPGVEYDRIYTLDQLDMKSVYMSIHSTTYRTALLQQNEIRLQEKTFYVDVEYQLLPIPYVKTVLFFKESVYKYMVGNVNQSVNVENFVRRYDNHDRVVRRILEFLKTAEFTAPQKDYVYNVFEKVLYTHYALSSIYDKDLERGRQRSITFDLFLKEMNPELYGFIGRKYSNIRRLRARKFVVRNPKFNKLRVLKRILLDKKPAGK